MKKQFFHITYICIAAVALVFIIFEQDIKSWQFTDPSLNLNNLKLKNPQDNTVSLKIGSEGSIILYSQFLNCSACIRKLRHLSNLAQTYPSISFVSILEGEEGKESFFNLLLEYDIPGQFLVDQQRVIKDSLFLGNHSYLLFFNRNQQIIAIVPVDLSEEELLKQMHTYISEM